MLFSHPNSLGRLLLWQNKPEPQLWPFSAMEQLHQETWESMIDYIIQSVFQMPTLRCTRHRFLRWDKQLAQISSSLSLPLTRNPSCFRGTNKLRASYSMMPPGGRRRRGWNKDRRRRTKSTLSNRVAMLIRPPTSWCSRDFSRNLTKHALSTATSHSKGSTFRRAFS